MQYRSFGKTGKQVSLLGFGGNRFAEADLMDQAGLDRCAQLVTYAIESGINYFDCSPSYAKGYNEQILGRGIQAANSDNPIYISAKSGLQIDKTADDIRRRIERSLGYLEVGRISFYHIWSVMSWQEYTQIMSPGGLYEGVSKAKEEGLLEHLCISVHCNDDEIMKILDDNAFEGITIVFNAINYRSKLRIIRKAYEQGWGVATMNSLAGGLIPTFPQLFESLDETDLSVSQKALRFNASFKEISTVLSGMPAKEQIKENVQSFEDEINTKPAEQVTFSIPIKEEMCSGCRYCEGCPRGIDVASNMQAYNMYLLTSGDCPKTNSMSEKYNLKVRQSSMDGMFSDKLGVSERSCADRMFHELRSYGVNPLNQNKCVGCGQCEKKCTRHINIRERLQTMSNIASEHGYSKGDIIARLDEVRDRYRGKKIAVWPSCVYVNSVFDLYDNPEFESDCEYFNSSEKMWGTTFRGKTVHSGDDLEELGIGVILIVTWRYRNEIYNQLTDRYGSRLPVVMLQERDDDIGWFN